LVVARNRQEFAGKKHIRLQSKLSKTQRLEPEVSAEKLISDIDSSRTGPHIYILMHEVREADQHAEWLSDSFEAATIRLFHGVLRVSLPTHTQQLMARRH
jgi:hypothetical protein